MESNRSPVPCPCMLGRLGTPHTAALCLPLLLLVIGCGPNARVAPSSDTTAAAPTGGISLSVRFPEVGASLIPSACQSVEAVLTENATSNELGRAIMTRHNPTALLTGFPTGMGCRLTAKAYPNADATGTAQASGTVGVTIPNGANEPIGLTMGTTIHRVEVAPNPAYVEIGATQLFTPTAFDAGRNVVLTADDWAWSTTDEARATVDGAGNLMALTEGSAMVWATDGETGLGAAASVAVVTSLSRITYQYQLQWGTPDWASLDSPSDVAVDHWGDVYVVDAGAHGIQKFDSQGSFITQWGSRGEGDGQFCDPKGIAVDSSGNVYVVDPCNSRV